MTHEELVKKLSAQIVARIKEDKENNREPMTDEAVRRMVEEQVKLLNDPKPEDKSSRKDGEFDIDQDKIITDDLNPLKGVKVKIDDGVEMDVKMLMSKSELNQYYQPSLSDKLVEWQKMNDDLLILGTMLYGKVNKNQLVATMPQILRDTKMYQRAMTRLKSDGELRKALYTSGAGAGLEWIPTGFSNQLMEKIRLAQMIEATIPQINMPTNPYKIPVESAGATGYFVPESTADEATKIKASSPTTANFTFNAKKFAGRVVYSEEVDEDSIVNIMDFTRNSLVIAISEAKETALLNGDDSTTHQDSNVTDSYDARKAFKGLRYYALNCAATSYKDASNANLSTTLLRGTRLLMGKFGVNPRNLFYACSPIGYIQFLNISELLTLDKYGPQATILNGEIGRFDGAPVLVSEFMWDNLNASGVYDATTTNRTSVLLYHRNGFMIGNRTGVTLATDRDIERDQMKLVAKQRIAFEDPYDATVSPYSVSLINVKTTV